MGGFKLKKGGGGVKKPCRLWVSFASSKAELENFFRSLNGMGFHMFVAVAFNKGVIDGTFLIPA